MRADSLSRVLDALVTHPQTLSQLCKRSGLSRNTVKSALAMHAIEPVPHIYPPSFVTPTKEFKPLPLPNVPTITDDDDRVMVGLLQDDDWVTRWNNARPLFVRQLNALVLEPHADRDYMTDAFTSGARSLASIAYALQQVADMPDWYTRLGGSLESDEDSK